ncbi:MAG: hypothetical protein A2252_01075 [Elusimicrobia bacterium RIFOXYA2_FULL_39_19]|nr:MAG: hypothetical protein A2252_01075 [Elusimicrobia bacterium RIFOXYA2_FULL_39_19]
MKKFDTKYFVEFDFTKNQVEKNFENAQKDLQIAIRDNILDVKFNYAYTSLIKAGIALLSHHKVKVRSVPGHHLKIIESLAQLLKDNAITDMGNLMRSKRNIDLYAGGIEVMQKECVEYLSFVEKVVKSVRQAIAKQ